MSLLPRLFTFCRTVIITVTPNWYTKLSQLFIALMLIHTIRIFEGFWWSETFYAVSFTLLFAVAADWLLPRSMRALRIVVQLLLAVGATAYFADLKKVASTTVPDQENRLGDLFRTLWGYAEQLHPFIWICGALLVLYILFDLWITTRLRLFGFISVNILVLTIADSFTPIWLWDEVAWIVFLGLLWLVANHLHKLASHHPNSWRELTEYPLQLLMPIVIVLSVLMSAGILMPTVSPIIQDPYTMWKESKGETVNVFLGDKGIAAPVDVSSSNTKSGYGRDDSELGGGFDFDYSPVMTITTNHRSYWRGETKTEYTGAGWTVNDETERSRLASVGKDWELPLIEGREKAETMKVDQQVRMSNNNIYPVLFAASPITAVHWVDDPDASVLPKSLKWAVNEQELIWSDKPLRRYPQSYAVTSEVTILDEEGLRKTEAELPDPAETKQYLQLPSSLPGRVRSLAVSLTASAVNDYDKAKLIETYLRQNFMYTNEPDKSRLTGDSKDFVDQFLFELKEGYCDYFSTAMAVMSRSIGLPTRWVKGFAPGVLPVSEYVPSAGGIPSEAELNPDGAGTYTVRNSDAHSWVEIYFDGYGWIPFEPTSGFTFPYSVTEVQQEALPTPTAAVDTDPVQEEVTDSTGSNHSAIIWGSVSAAVLIVLVLVIVLLRTPWIRSRYRAYSGNDRIVWETEKLLRLCRRKGYERGEHETLREAIQRWSPSHKRLNNLFREVLDEFERAKYSSVQATSSETDRFILKIKAIKEEL
ncbi:transglutaminase TgpA family protein [Paenibacillus glycanilyticus]|uniref:transglutaminase TgpA family protein n=1 Tax=Paenibacillus glycanilyticus TaxID=126569 RepID=UPI0019105001|nr:transglutaminaseTgpA domain-containing protein [Paenibacillus glycanilyticus]